MSGTFKFDFLLAILTGLEEKLHPIMTQQLFSSIYYLKSLYWLKMINIQKLH